jgi:DNA-binding NarL/FixJ family response regulator
MVVLNELVEPRLLRATSASSLSVLKVTRAEEALLEIIRLRPHAIVVQVGRVLDEPLKLIRLVAERSAQVPVIAVATSHDCENERAIRVAGATCYLSGGECHLVGQVLESLKGID